MSRLDDLKDAMAAPPDFTAQPVDLGTIMTTGGRIRRRRRLGVTAASGLAVAVLLVGGTQLFGTAASPGLELPAGAPGSAVPSPSRPPAGKVLGQVESTGYGSWVVYAVGVNDTAIPGTTFGVMAGVRKADGSVKGVIETNEANGPGKSPGFHAVEGAMEAGGKTNPTFGYYVGPATKITGVAGGRPVTAGRAVWSEDPSVQFFWFGTAKQVSKLTAFDKSGKKLAAGSNTVGVG
jgi:hypothetical protein